MSKMFDEFGGATSIPAIAGRQYFREVKRASRKRRIGYLVQWLLIGGAVLGVPWFMCEHVFGLSPLQVWHMGDSLGLIHLVALIWALILLCLALMILVLVLMILPPQIQDGPPATPGQL